MSEADELLVSTHDDDDGHYVNDWMPRKFRFFAYLALLAISLILSSSSIIISSRLSNDVYLLKNEIVQLNSIVAKLSLSSATSTAIASTVINNRDSNSLIPSTPLIFRVNENEVALDASIIRLSSRDVYTISIIKSNGLSHWNHSIAILFTGDTLVWKWSSNDEVNIVSCDVNGNILNEKNPGYILYSGHVGSDLSTGVDRLYGYRFLYDGIYYYKSQGKSDLSGVVVVKSTNDYLSLIRALNPWPVFDRKNVRHPETCYGQKLCYLTPSLLPIPYGLISDPVYLALISIPLQGRNNGENQEGRITGEFNLCLTGSLTPDFLINKCTGEWLFFSIREDRFAVFARRSKILAINAFKATNYGVDVIVTSTTYENGLYWFKVESGIPAYPYQSLGVSLKSTVTLSWDSQLSSPSNPSDTLFWSLSGYRHYAGYNTQLYHSTVPVYQLPGQERLWNMSLTTDV